jgi:hypothetical protein
MEPSLPMKMKELVSHKVHPEKIVKMLTSSYRGYSQMADLLGNWLQIMGFSHEKIQTLLEDQTMDLIVQTFDPQKADSIFSEGMVCSMLQLIFFSRNQFGWKV